MLPVRRILFFTWRIIDKAEPESMMQLNFQNHVFSLTFDTNDADSVSISSEATWLHSGYLGMSKQPKIIPVNSSWPKLASLSQLVPVNINVSQSGPVRSH